jgi:hypothetical protein
MGRFPFRSREFFQEVSAMMVRLALGGWLLCFGLVGAGPAPAAQEPAEQTDPELAALEGRVEQFFEGLGAGQAAFQELLAGSRLLDQTEALGRLVEGAGGLTGKYGRYVGAEQVGAKRIGADLVTMRYLYKCEELPVVWYFVFYRTPSSTEGTAAGVWRVVGVRFDTDLDALR